MKILRNIAFFSFIICFIIQIAYIITYWNFAQYSDCGYYINLAENTFQSGGFYPTIHNLYDAYIFAPGFVNMLVVELNCFGTVKINAIVNLLMHMAITWEIFFLCKKFFNLRTAYLAVILYSSIYTNWEIIPLALTEVPYLFFVLTAFCLGLSDRLYHLIPAGVCLAIANSIRPLMLIFAVVLLAAMVINKRRIRHYLALLLPLVLCITVVGLTNKRKIGEFVYQSSTGGQNLLLSANDRAGVAVNISPWNNAPSPYIANAEFYGPFRLDEPQNTPNIAKPDDAAAVHNSLIETSHAKKYTFHEREVIYKERAVKWILSHPKRFISLYLQKIIRLWINDSWTSAFLGRGDSLCGKFIGDSVKVDFIKDLFYRLVKSFMYYVCLLFFICALAIKRKEIFSEKGLFLLIMLLGTFLTCLFPGLTRYHHPLLFCMVIWSAYGIDGLLTNKEHRMADGSKQNGSEN